jgi:hypothetical protein
MNGEVNNLPVEYRKEGAGEGEDDVKSSLHFIRTSNRKLNPQTRW